jgi:hypothetical protein
MCGRIIEPDEGEVMINDPYDDEDDMPKKTLSFCQLCEAKLKHEADGSQKPKKPI